MTPIQRAAEAISIASSAVLKVSLPVEDIASILAKHIGGGWLPIESAPRNEAILVFVPAPRIHEELKIYVGMLYVGAERAQPTWVSMMNSGSGTLSDSETPTAWQPLPAPYARV